MNIKGTRTDIDYLFRNAMLNLEQIKNIGDICRILGRYIFVDRFILEARAGERIGLSCIKKAGEYNIIAEMICSDKNGSANRYFYQLGPGGYYLLEKAGERHIEMNILADAEMKSRILTFNYFALENNYDMTLKYNQDRKHRYFICKGDVICYFSGAVTENEIIWGLIGSLSKKDGDPFTSTDIRNKFRFMPIEKKMIYVETKTNNIRGYA